MKKRLLSAFLSLCMVLTMVPAVAFAVEDPNVVSESVNLVQGDETNANNNDSDDKQLAEKEELAGDGNESDLTESAPVYVSDSGNDETGEGTAESPYATLAKAVEVAENGATIYLRSNLTSTQYAIVSNKKITIDGNGYTVTRGEDFQAWTDGGRGGYNPALIEVANESTLTLRNITLDDHFLHEGTDFELAGNSQENNQNKVHDGIIASYGDGHSTIILGEGTTLKNFGGLAAVYITGENGDGAKLIMESGSKICDDELGEREGGYAAIYNHGGTFEMKSGASIEDIDGRAIVADNAAVTTINGSISDITSNDKVKFNAGAMNGGFGGILLYASGNAKTTLGSTAVISNIESHDNTSADVMLWLVGATFETEQGSVIKDIDIIGLADSNGSTMRLDGRVENCKLDKVLFRVRGGSGTFELEEHGIITNSSTSDYGIIYVQAGNATITISGTISECKVDHGGAVNLTSNGINSCICTVAPTGKIRNISGFGGYGISIDGPDTKVYIQGEISGCYCKAIYHKTVNSGSVVELNGGVIKDNNKGSAQIQITSTKASAIDAAQHVKIAPGVLKGNTTIDLSPFDVTLDEDYDAVKLGNASAAAADAIKNAVTTEHNDWTVVGSGALWFQPSEETLHFTASRHYSVKNTGLFAAIIPLQADGTPAADALVQFVEVQNTDPIDVSLTGLTPGQSYAMMFVNNNIYTLAPDDITIYTGGGQGDETYDDGGLPMLTVSNSVDDIKTLSIGGEEITGDDLMDTLLSYLTVSYTDTDGNPVDSDEEAGEYTATLAWKDGNSVDLRINGNEVADEFDDGTLIVRYIEDVEEATSGESTYPLLTDEPADPVTHAEAIAKKNILGSSPSFYTNNDENRKVDAGGIQILDDSLLIDEDGTDRQSLLEDKAEASNLLPALGEGQAYRYDFHYLDLVDAYNGNAWVSASYGTTVYLPYPEGTDQNTNFTLVHFKDLHREYGISGQADVEDAIAACELEAMEITMTDVGIQFDVEEAGFSPFALVWQTDAVTITATAGNGGSISPAGEVVVAKGTDQKFTITPDSGYAIADVKVDGKSEGAVSTYIFENVTGDHTIEASFRSTGGSSSGGGTTYYTLKYESNGGTAYDDERYTSNTVVDLDKVPSREGYTFTGWYADAELTEQISEIKMTSNKTVYAGWEVTGVPDWLNGDDHFAYVIGYSDGTVKPLNNISRAEVATIFFRLLKPEIRDEYLTQTSQFTDVSADAWYNTAVSTMAALGIVNGRTADTFAPDASITRAEFAAICARFDTNKRDGDSNFSDIAGHWAEAEIERAATLGWINGYSDGTFHPDNAITRAEAMTMINRVLQRLPETEDDLLDDMNVWPDNQPSAWYYLAVQEATNSHDFDRKDDGVHETWTSRNTDPDWMQYQ